MIKRVAVPLLLALLLLAIDGNVSAQEINYRLRKLVTTEDFSPVDGKYTSISFTEAPSINIKGETTFIGTVAGHDATPYIFAVAGNRARLIAFGGATSPAGGKYLALTNAVINDKGQVCFRATLENNKQGIFLNNGEATEAVVLSGQTALAGEYFNEFRAISFNNNGDVAFIATLQSSGGEGVFIKSSNNISKVITVGDSLPGGGKFISIAGVSSLTINDKHALVFAANIGEAEAKSAVFLFSNGELFRLVDENVHSPLGGLFGEFSRPIINNNGLILFNASGDRNWELEQHYPTEEEEKTVGAFTANRDLQAKIVTGGDPYPSADIYEFERIFNRGIAEDGRVFFTNLVLEGRAATGVYSSFNDKVSIIAAADGTAPVGGKFKLVYGDSLNNNRAGIAVFAGLLENGATGLFMAIPINLLPQINGVSFAHGKLTISGANLGGDVTITINNQPLSAAKLSAHSDNKLVIEGSRRALGLMNRKDNIITVTINNVVSEPFTFSTSGK